MKALVKLVTVLVVLGFCLPSYGEILVYKFVDKSTCYEQDAVGNWDVWNETNKGYIVIEVNYDDYTITQAEGITYWNDKGDKKFDQNPIDLELVRVENKGKVEWVIMAKDLDLVGEQISGEFTLLTGKAISKKIGIADKREVANKLSGSGLEDTIDGDERYIDVSKISVTLFPAWTCWANGDGVDEGNQDFEATKQMIKDYLTGKGYTEED